MRNAEFCIHVNKVVDLVNDFMAYEALLLDNVLFGDQDISLFYDVCYVMQAI